MEAFIGLGSNMGDRLGNMGEALRRMQDYAGVVAVSHAYESEPWGVTDQPPFANAVARIDTALSADRLLDALKETEADMGRTPGERYGPRVIDLDILLFDDEEWRAEDLIIPHPRLLERDFAVTPLLEIEPHAALPDGSPVAARSSASEGRILRVLGDVPGWEEYTPTTEPGQTADVFRNEPAAPRPVPLDSHGRTPAGWESEDFRGVPPSMDIRYGGRDDVIRTETGEEWAALGASRLDPSPGTGDLLFFEAVLKDAGIPSEFYPHRPNEGYNPWGVGARIDLFVPSQRLAEARRLIDEVRRAVPEPIDDGGGDDGSDDE